MSPLRMAGPAYWASGGGVEGRCGALELDDALALLVFLSGEADARSRSGDAAGARFCAEQALELRPAVARAISWRNCCAGPDGIRVSRETAPTGLRKA